ncbi:MAG: hypothetical protein WB579_05250 [Bryobacteraceae bacterium]
MAARITRGLFAFERKSLLAPGYVATARALDGFTPEAAGDLQKMAAFVVAAPLQSIGRVFSYRFGTARDDPQFSVALFEVYEATSFLGLTIRRADNAWSDWV